MNLWQIHYKLGIRGSLQKLSKIAISRVIFIKQYFDVAIKQIIFVANLFNQYLYMTITWCILFDLIFAVRWADVFLQAHKALC